MRFKWTKVIVVCAVVVIIVTLASIQVFARDFYMAGHYDPTGTTTTTYAYPSSECDRNINVSYYDTSGNFLKKVVIHTKKGMEASFHIGLGGYDITKFESNQGLWETCKMSWTSGTGTCTELNTDIADTLPTLREGASYTSERQKCPSGLGPMSSNHWKAMTGVGDNDTSVIAGAGEPGGW